MELIVGFIVMVVVALWTLGVPIALIVIAVKISGIHNITLSSQRQSEKLIKEMRKSMEEV